MHDLTGDKKSAIQTKLDIVKFMGEVMKYNGNTKEALADKAMAKKTSLNLAQIRAALKDDNDVDNYNLHTMKP